MTSIAELRSAGITFETDEAVAIVQQLIARLRFRPAPDDVQPPYGPPSAESVGLNQDGSVSCRGCKTTPTLSEVGIFLHSLLPAGSPTVPGSLRYTIACALLTVDMPPFDSLTDFSRDLSRHERGDRADAVQRVFARYVFEPAVPPSGRAPERLVARTLFGTASRGGALAAAAACLVAAIAWIGARESMRLEPTPLAAMQTVPAVAAPIAGGRRLAPARVGTPSRLRQGVGAQARQTRSTRSDARVLGRGIIVVHDVSSQPQRAASSLTGGKGVMERLRLGWLRHAFAQ